MKLKRKSGGQKAREKEAENLEERGNNYTNTIELGLDSERKLVRKLIILKLIILWLKREGGRKERERL